MATYQQDDHELDKKGEIDVGVTEVNDLSAQPPSSKLARFYRSALVRTASSTLTARSSS